jgi:DNA-binding CsgD family transcriptional regulator
VSASAIDIDGLKKAQARFGEAVLDPGLWPEIMEDVCRAVRATGALLLQTDARTPDVPRTNSVDELVNYYFRNGWHTRDIRAVRALPLLRRGTRAFVDEDILTPEELRKVDFFNECTLPKGFKWAAGVGFSAGSSLWGLCLHRTVRQRAFGQEDSRVLSELSAKLTEVATLSTAIGRRVISGAVTALELVGKPALAIDRFGFIIDANALAADVLDSEVAIVQRRLKIADGVSRAEFERLLDILRYLPDRATLPATNLTIKRKGQRALLVRVLSVDGAARQPFLGARALLLISDLERPLRLDATDVAEVFGLTPAEARFAVKLATGVSLERAADELGIAYETARNQTKRIFQKTDTHRQAELVALLNRYL